MTLNIGVTSLCPTSTSHMDCWENKLTKGIQKHKLKALLFATDVQSALVQSRLLTVVFCVKPQVLGYLTGLY